MADRVVLDDATAAALLPERPARAHKGTFGKVLVIAGSLDFAGAGLLASGAAARAGAGLVVLAVPASLQPVVAARIPEITTRGLAESSPGEVDSDLALADLADVPHDAIVIGPGLAPLSSTDDLVTAVLSARREPAAVPAIVDAEALNALARREDWAGIIQRPAVLTPHPGEFARLCQADRSMARWADPGDDDDARAESARAAAGEWGMVVVLKGAHTVIASPEGTVATAPFENPALATAGSGDVLSGTVGAFLGQGLTPWDAARLGVYVHGVAGDAVREVLGDAGATASDLVPQLPLALRRLSRSRGGGRRPLGFAASTGSGP
jgi:NAD(P)H-hydrate epimerase